jgi:hypothetical protein
LADDIVLPFSWYDAGGGWDHKHVKVWVVPVEETDLEPRWQFVERYQGYLFGVWSKDVELGKGLPHRGCYLGLNELER